MGEPDMDRDPLVAAALRALQDPRPRGEPAWERLEGRIRWGARDPLWRLRQPRRWWEQTARWARTAIPLGVAAGVAALLAIARAEPSTPAPGAPTEVAVGAAPVSFYGVLADAESERDLVDATVGSTSDYLILADEETR